MSRQIENTDQIRQYLLGELSEEEREGIEQRLLSDDDYYQQVLIAEEELAYDFARNELPDQDRIKFTRHALPVPEWRQEVKFARALSKYVEENGPRRAEAPAVSVERRSWLEPLAAFFRRPAVGFSLAAALLLSLALVAWTATRNRRLNDEVARLRAQSSPSPVEPQQDLQEQLATERLRNAELTDELRREQELRAGIEKDLQVAREQAGVPAPTPSRTGGPPVVGFLLTAGSVRDSGKMNTVRRFPDARVIRLDLDLAADEYQSYLAVLKAVGGQKELLSKKSLRARAGRDRVTVSVSLAASLLSRGDYQIQLSGLTPSGAYEDVETYYFRVEN